MALLSHQHLGFTAGLNPAPVLLHRHYAAPRQSRSVVASAKRRELDRDYLFSDLYDGVAEKVSERTALPQLETLQMIECIKTADQANKCLDLIRRYITAKEARLTGNSQLSDEDLMSGSTSGTTTAFQQQQQQQPQQQQQQPQQQLNDVSKWLSDWPVRKRFLSRICEIAVLELDKPELLFGVIGNISAYKISTYFGKELIQDLGEHGSVPVSTLQQVAQLVRQQRGPYDKGTRGAYMALLEVMKARGMSQEAMAPVKQALRLSRPASQQAPPAPTSISAAAPVAPPPTSTKLTAASVAA